MRYPSLQEHKSREHMFLLRNERIILKIWCSVCRFFVVVDIKDQLQSLQIVPFSTTFLFTKTFRMFKGTDQVFFLNFSAKGLSKDIIFGKSTKISNFSFTYGIVNLILSLLLHYECKIRPKLGTAWKFGSAKRNFPKSPAYCDKYIIQLYRQRVDCRLQKNATS